jgi:hypothetical protein
VSVGMWPRVRVHVTIVLCLNYVLCALINEPLTVAFGAFVRVEFSAAS